MFHEKTVDFIEKCVIPVSQYRLDEIICGGRISYWPIIFWIIYFLFTCFVLFLFLGGGGEYVISSVIISRIVLGLFFSSDKICVSFLWIDGRR